MSRPNVDVVIAGGGPIGLAAAIGCRLAGLRCAVVEPRSTPIDKACGEGVMPGAVQELARLGIDPGGYAYSGIRYVSSLAHAEHRFRRGEGRGIRRTQLQSALASRADELGVERTGGKVTSFDQDDDAVVVNGIRSRWLLGCDGLHSTVRELAGLGRASPRVRRFGIRRHFAVEPWSRMVEVYWAERAEVYVTPVAADEVGVAVLGPARTEFDAAIASVPSLHRRLDTAEPASAIRGAGPLWQRTRRRTAGRVLLVGDASGYVDALTGEGIGVGLAQARAAVEALVHDDPGAYESRWYEATRNARVLTSGLVAVAQTPLRSALVPAAARLPSAFGAIVERLAR